MSIASSLQHNPSSPRIDLALTLQFSIDMLPACPTWILSTGLTSSVCTILLQITIIWALGEGASSSSYAGFSLVVALLTVFFASLGELGHINVVWITFCVRLAGDFSFSIASATWRIFLRAVGCGLYVECFLAQGPLHFWQHCSSLSTLQRRPAVSCYISQEALTCFSQVA